MMNSSISVRLKKGKTYFALGGIALIALLSSSSLLHAIKSLEEIDEKAHREATLKVLEKNALTGELKANRKYLKRVAEFLKEDPSYLPVTMGSDESPATFFENIHTQALKNLSDSLLPSLATSFERARLNFFYYRVGLSGKTEESVHKEIERSLQCTQLAICGEGNHLPTHSPGIADAIQSRAERFGGLNVKVRYFKERYLSEKPDERILKDIARSATDLATSITKSEEEKTSLLRLAARINSKLAESVK